MRIGISSCLLGEKVRFDGGDKEDRSLTGIPASWIEWVPVCPEFEVGLGVPRERMRLEGKPEAPRLMTIETRIDHTQAMEHFARRRVAELGSLGLDGYIFKSRSPSCGVREVPVYASRVGHARNRPARPGAGLFAREFMIRFPRIPVEEEGRLAVPALRRRFFERAFAHGRWRRLVESGLTRARLAEFHAGHREQLEAHSPSHLAVLDRLVAARTARLVTLAARYEELFTETLRLPPRRQIQGIRAS